MTRVVCDRCGATEEIDRARDAGWLVCTTASGRMVIRCPDHITRYAITRCPFGRVRGGYGVVGGRRYPLRSTTDQR